MSGTITRPLTFQPWNVDRPEQPLLKDVLARVHQERGHFRNITEASLQDEIANQGALDSSSSDDEDEGEHDSEDVNGKGKKAPTTREELFNARKEMNEHINSAHQDIMMALDFISLLESKHAPGQASVTMSPALKNELAPGCLGTDVWDSRKSEAKRKRDAAREAQDDLLAGRVRMSSLQQSADDLLAAATRLQDNVRRETVFWDQVLNISERGWKVSKLHKHLLGVHIGFGDAAMNPAKSVAALYSDGEGSIALERGIGSKPKAVRVVVRRGDDIVGCSKVPVPLDQDEASLDARIRHARDSVFDEELFHEMIRESHTLTSQAVSMKGASIEVSLAGQRATKLEFELISLDTDITLSANVSHELDVLAEAILLTARLLMSQERRERTKQRSSLPAPMTDKKNDDIRNASILRPLILLGQHHHTVSLVNSYLDTVSTVLRTASLSAKPQAARLSLEMNSDGSMSAESLVESLSRPISSEGVLCVVDSSDKTLEIRIQVETAISNPVGWSLILTRPNGAATRFSNMDDLLEAADEFTGIAIGEVLKTTLGSDWIFDSREGSLRKVIDSSQQNPIWITVNHIDQDLTLTSGRIQQGKKVAWNLDGTGEERSIQEVLKELAG